MRKRRSRAFEALFSRQVTSGRKGKRERRKGVRVFGYGKRKGDSLVAIAIKKKINLHASRKDGQTVE